MAAAFRLIRRTLLCLLVGLTAFGVSGWLLRPKATDTSEYLHGYRTGRDEGWRTEGLTR